MNEKDIKTIAARPGYGIASSIGGGGIKGGISAGAAASKIGGAGALDNVESDIGDESLGAKKLQIGYSGLPEIRITFHRRRLADHSRSVSEKSLVDSLQYAGLICGDSESEIRLTHVAQAKVGSNEEERTVVDIIYPEVDFNNLWIPAKKNLGR